MLDRIFIEISNICNLQCTFCPVVERDKKVMGPEDFEKILVQAKPLAKQVCLHLMGEPLAHPNFSKIMAICEDNGVPVQITTNGVVIAGRKDVLLKSKVLRQINFSIQSYKDNFPNRDFNTYLRPILDFSRELHEVSPETYVNYRLWNLGRSEQIMKENEEVFQTLERFYDIEINRRTQVESIKSKRIWNKVYLHFDSHFDWPSWDLPNQGEVGKCHALKTHIGIHADGTVVPCCLDKESQIPLGNVLDESLKSILSSPRAVAMRQGFDNNIRVEKFCQHCTYINRFQKN
ncbi:radical SAM/SPASM domain-containing protein [Halobacteriovorax sp. GFR7]|uniref:radical SAM/SPASM domain-containing protein n=1 Tax=unclassified Halobacteriovorax TaxID=2639665 RepID=UPI003D9578F5